uniref:Uncharacterized protein n=1 Tax=Salix viminalis TaxID=40686 RepID=A0A6N2ND73_SALVM
MASYYSYLYRAGIKHGGAVRILRALFGAAIFGGDSVHVCWNPTKHATTLIASIRVPSAGAFKHLKLSGGESILFGERAQTAGINLLSRKRLMVALPLAKASSHINLSLILVWNKQTLGE